MAGSFSGVEIIDPGQGYISGDICLQGYAGKGAGFNGTFEADPLNGSILSVKILFPGANYSSDPAYAGLCYRGSSLLQVVL